MIYGAGGAVGGAVARAFAREGARLFLIGRNLASVDKVVKDILAAGGVAETAQVDALDEQAVENHVGAVVKRAGSIDISFNAITPVPQPGTQGIPIAQLSVESFTAAINGYARTHFLDGACRSATHSREEVRRDPHAHAGAPQNLSW